MQNFNSEKLKSLLKIYKNNWQDILHSVIENSIIKMAVLLKLVYWFNTIPVRMLPAFFDAKIHVENSARSEEQQKQKSLKNNSSLEGTTLPDF